MNQIGLAMGGMALLWGGTLYVAAKPTVSTAPAAFSERFPDEMPHSLKKQDRIIPVKTVAVAAVDIVNADQINVVDLMTPPVQALQQDEPAQDDPDPAPRQNRRNERNERNERDERNVCTRHHLRKVWVTNRKWRCRR